MFSEPVEPSWTDAQLAELDEHKQGFIDQIQQLRHEPRQWESVLVGDELAPNVLGPHSLASFATEWRAYPMTVWGATAKGPTTVRAEALGYTKEMAGFEGDRRRERTNPELSDGAYYGWSRRPDRRPADVDLRSRRAHRGDGARTRPGRPARDPRRTTAFVDGEFDLDRGALTKGVGRVIGARWRRRCARPFPSS